MPPSVTVGWPSQARTVETRVRIDTHCNNDGALFAAPTYPGKVLDGNAVEGGNNQSFVAGGTLASGVTHEVRAVVLTMSCNSSARC